MEQSRTVRIGVCPDKLSFNSDLQTFRERLVNISVALLHGSMEGWRHGLGTVSLPLRPGIVVIWCQPQ